MPRGLPDSWTGWAIQRGAYKLRQRGGGGGGGNPLRGAPQVKYAYKFSDLVLYRDKFEEMINGEKGMVGRYIRARGRAVVVAAKNQVDVKTGTLKRSIVMIHTRHSYGHKLWIGSKLSYAYLHHEGTRPHRIDAKGPTILRFTKGGRVVYARSVNHPGTRPNRYLTDQLPLIFI